MMRMKAMTKGISVINGKSGGDGGVGDPEAVHWEVRPSGMLVQQRNPDSSRDSGAPTIRVKVKYGSCYHEIYINSQASFGELKKLLSERTGLHHEDQKLLFKDKERNSNAYLDLIGVKDGSKLVLVEDELSREKRFLEMRKNAKMEKASKSISEISSEVDKLAAQVSAFESVISKGSKVAETHVLNLIEMLMNQLIKLDGIIADGDVKVQRKMQVRRVQKYVETLDVLKIRNAMPSSYSSGNGNNNGGQGQAQQQQQPQQKHLARRVPDQVPLSKPIQQPHRHSTSLIPHIKHLQQRQQQPARHSAEGIVATTQWETFDFELPTPPASNTAATTTTTTIATGAPHSQSHAPSSKSSWDFFL